jgi:polyphosphate kinase
METQRLFDRELSWLAFNYRVLQEAKDPTVPLYERIKFIAIFSSNLEEFFRIRVASLRTLLDLGKKTQKALEFDPALLLKKIHKTVTTQQEEYGQIFREHIIPELNKNHIYLIDESQLNREQANFVTDYFYDNVLMHISPMMIVKRKVSPFLKSGLQYLAIKLAPKSIQRSKKKKQQSKKSRIRHKYAMIEIPSDKLPRFIELPRYKGNDYVIFLDDIIKFALPNIFPGYDIAGTYSIKLTRDAHLHIDDEFTGNLREKIQKSLQRRSRASASRFLYDKSMPKPFLKLLKESLELEDEDLVPGGRYHNFYDFFSFPNPGRKDLDYKPLPPLKSRELNPYANFFDAWGGKDVILHFPYQKYDYVLDALNTAAEDPNVRDIKITQYRLAKDSRVIKALINAMKHGKNVVVFMELKARFDEESNMNYSRMLESAGAKVLYSLPGLKVHCKTLLVTREENGSIRKYGYFATGNFNEKTAKLYTDLGLFTSDERLVNELSDVFDYLETRQTKPEFKHLLVGKFNLRHSFYRLIDRETANAKKGKPAFMILKMNGLEEPKIIEKLYEASNAGVKIRLIVRGICCLIPGIKGMSENIEVISILDRFLEHTRMYYFYNEGNDEIYLSSADMMKRNLRKRIEVAFPVYDEGIKKTIKDLLDIQWSDNVKARIIDKDQTNQYRAPGEPKIRAQYTTYEYMKKNF